MLWPVREAIVRWTLIRITSNSLAWKLVAQLHLPEVPGKLSLCRDTEPRIR